MNAWMDMVLVVALAGTSAGYLVWRWWGHRRVKSSCNGCGRCGG